MTEPTLDAIDVATRPAEITSYPHSLREKR